MKKMYVVIFVLVLITIVLFMGYRNYQVLLISTERGLAIGKSYGKLVRQSDCLEPLKIQYKGCNKTACELSANGFIVGCMETRKMGES